MPLEVAEGDDDIGVHDRAADLGLFDKGQIHGDEGLIRALETVGNDDMAAGLEGGKPVQIGCLHVVEGVLARPHIECVGICEKGFAALRLHIIRNHLCILRPQMGQVSEFPEVDLDRGIPVFKIDAFKACTLHKAVQLLRQGLSRRRVEIGEEYG